MQPLTPAQIKTHYDAALKHLAARRFDDALKLLQQIVAANPNIAEVHYQVGKIGLDSNRPQLALRPLRAAARLKPQEPSIWRSWAEAVALGGRAEDEADFLAALKVAQIKPDLKIHLQDRFGAQKASSRRTLAGQSAQDTQRLLDLMKDRKYAEAEQMARRLLSLYPLSAFTVNVLGGALAMQGKLPDAIEQFRKSIQIDPNYAEAHDNLGRILLDMNRVEEAARHFRVAVTLTPYLMSAIINHAACLSRMGFASAAFVPLERMIAAHPDLVICRIALGNAQTRARNYAQAEATLLQAVELSKGSSAEALGLLAQAQARLGKDELALENFDKALKLDPNSPLATGGKASALQTLGRFEEADDLFLRAFDLDPNNGEIYRSYVAAQKVKAGDPIIARMQARYDDPILGDLDRMNLGFALSKAMEDTKEYARVFPYLNRANALMRKIYPYDPALRDREISMFKSALDGVDWHNISVPDATDYAPIFVTGMPRSGTTLIEQIISSHSRVTGAGEVGKVTAMLQKALAQGDRFRPVSGFAPSEIAALGVEYATYMREMFPGKPQATDKSIQTYMYIGLAKLALPNARIIVVRRDPRDTLLSMYKNKFPDGTHLAAYDQRDLVHLYASFVDMVNFWRERVPDWFYEVEYETLVANPEPETRKLIAASGLEWEDACLSPQDNDRKVETLSLFQVRQPISGGSVKGWKRYEKDLAPMLDELRKLGLVSD